MDGLAGDCILFRNKLRDNDTGVEYMRLLRFARNDPFMFLSRF